MNTRSRISVAGTAVAVALAASVVVLAAPPLRTAPRGVGRVSDFTTIRDRVQGWLSTQGFTGFAVSEVMAFSNNHYVAVNDKSGKPAFELLYYPRTNWLMEEQAG